MDKRIKADRRATSQPIKLNKLTIDAVLSDIKDGSTHDRSCLAHGIAPRTFYYWKNQGECDLENDVYDTLHAYLVQELAKIEQKEIKDCRQQIRMCPKGHEGAQWTLEHVYAKDFGNNAAIKELNEKLDKLLFEKDQG